MGRNRNKNRRNRKKNQVLEKPKNLQAQKPEVVEAVVVEAVVVQASEKPKIQTMTVEPDAVREEAQPEPESVVEPDAVREEAQPELESVVELDTVIEKVEVDPEPDAAIEAVKKDPEAEQQEKVSVEELAEELQQLRNSIPGMVVALHEYRIAGCKLPVEFRYDQWYQMAAKEIRGFCHRETELEQLLSQKNVDASWTDLSFSIFDKRNPKNGASDEGPSLGGGGR